jgi:CHAD domain-containing protein
MAKAKEIVGLDCSASAEGGIRLALLTRLEEVGAFREQALDFSDIKGVHDMRVASRRLRSASRDFAPFLRKGRLDKAIEDLRELADVLGNVRDLDVSITALEKLAQDAPQEIAEGIREIIRDSNARREKARAVLTESLTAELIEDLRLDFARGIEAATRARKPRASGDSSAPIERTFRTVGREVVLRQWDELHARSKALRNPHKTRPLHRMRISAKRLRYAVELFSQCWDESLPPFAEEIAEIQGDLGNLHDCDVWIETLGEQLEKRDQEDTTDDSSSNHRMAIVWLLGHFTTKRTRNYNDALMRWYEWGKSDFGRRLAESVDDAETSGRPSDVEELTK